MHPKRPSSRFEPELLPHSMICSIEYWLSSELIQSTDEPTVKKVNNFLLKFRSSFISYINGAKEYQIPSMVKASKARCAKLVNFCQGVILLLLDDYSCHPLTKDFELLKSSYKARFAKKIFGYNPSESVDDVLLDVDISNNPKSYRYLYDMAICILMSKLDKQEMLRYFLIIQSEAHIYEAVKLTDSEIIEAEQEFLASANEPDCWEEDSLLARTMVLVSKDMKSKKPPLYIADFKQVRRHHDGYLFNNPWTVRDAWFSVRSSGSSLNLNGKSVPSIGLLLSAVEPDYFDPVDPLIGYKSLYPTCQPEGLKFNPSTTVFVPKTSSRGLRAIHMNSNSRQDRGSYFEGMCSHTLKNVVKCDTTFPKSGQDGTEFIRSQTSKGDAVLICTDMSSATDHISHQFLINFWNILFAEGIANSLLNLHSGDGIFISHQNIDGKLIKTESSYKQVSGIKCGTRSNFAVGLTYAHNFILRCTMKVLGMEDVDPSEIYTVHGDDNALALAPEIWEKFLSTYIQLCSEAGFRVHDLDQKGMISFPGDSLYRAEYNKQVFSKGFLISRIPHRIFFSKKDAESKLRALLWLSQYEYAKIDGSVVERLFLQPYAPNAKGIWNFLIKKKMFGLPSTLIVDGEFEINEFNIAVQVFINAISVGVKDCVLNNRNRLSERQVKSKVDQMTALFEDEDILNDLIDWNANHAIGIGKLELTISKNKFFSDEMKLLFKDPIIWGSSLLGFFTPEEQDLILRCLPYARFSLDEDLSMIDDLLSAANILQRIQPHSVVKRSKTRSSTIIKILSSLEVSSSEDPYFHK